jgi:GT2 family glycosyltransferase
MSVAMAASVVIPSYQSAATIRRCLASVLAQHVKEGFEVVVVDSGTDGTADIVRKEFPGVRLLKARGRLDAARARNWGAREALGSILAFIDSDCVPDTNWLARLMTALKETGCDGVGGAIRPIDGSNSAGWAGYFCEFREFLPRGTAGEATYLTPGNVAYRRQAFERAGGFPSGYFPLEDQVFYQRLQATGSRTHFDPSIVVAHAHRDDIAAFLAHQVKIGSANSRVVLALGLKGYRLASRPWLAAALLPALASYRFARTVAACWRQERFLMVRRPAVAGLCWLGMFAWGIGFARPAARTAPLPRLATE